MKLSRVTWRILLAGAISGGMLWNSLAAADQVSGPQMGECQFCSEHDAVYDAEVYGQLSDALADSEPIEKITVIHTAGRQSVTLSTSHAARSAGLPELASEVVHVAETATQTDGYQADLSCDEESYEYDYGSHGDDHGFADVSIAADAETGQRDEDRTASAVEEAAETAWDEYGAYDEYDYDEYYYENYENDVDETADSAEAVNLSPPAAAAEPTGEETLNDQKQAVVLPDSVAAKTIEAVTPLPEDEEMRYDEYGYDEFSIDETVADSADDSVDQPETERNIWGEPIVNDVAETAVADQPQASPRVQPSPRAVAVDDEECNWADWDCSYEFDPTSDPAGQPEVTASSVECGNSVRHLRMQALQILARSCDHAGRTLQVVSNDLMRISGESVAQRTSHPRN